MIMDGKRFLTLSCGREPSGLALQGRNTSALLRALVGTVVISPVEVAGLASFTKYRQEQVVPLERVRTAWPKEA